MKNQCDGCRRGLPIDANGNHQGPTPYDLQGCTKHRYVQPKPGYGTTPAAGPYGARIFVLKANRDAADPILKPLSMWKGADKDWGASLGYEFDAANFALAKEQLAAAGFEENPIKKFY